ncbi:hypothetical protein V2L90_00995, partial [Streptococcus pneumoniae]
IREKILHYHKQKFSPEMMVNKKQVNFFWVANFNLKFGEKLSDIGIAHILSMYSIQNYFRSYIPNLKSV